MKFIKKNSIFFLSLGLFLIAFVPRIIAAFSLAWRPSEINYVDWIGQWFSVHFWQYLFQFFHNTYPPKSDVFGNPPFAMWIMTLGIYVAQKLHFSLLLGARLINVIIGSFSVVYLFFLAKKWFSFRVGILAALFFALIPVVITNNSTAYLDTILALLILISLDLTYRYAKSKRPKYIYLLGIILGLSLLTKLVVVPVIVCFWVLILFLQEKKLSLPFIIFLILSLIVPVVLWSGFRDPRHYAGLVSVYQSGIFNPYPLQYSTPSSIYYYVMLLGVLPPIAFVSGLLEFFFLLKKINKEGWKKNWFFVFILILLFSFITYNSFFAPYTTTHQLVSIMPLFLILAALGFDLLYKKIRISYLRIFTITILIFSLLIPLFIFKPQFWGMYGSSLVGGSNNAYKLFSAGSDGEEVPQVAQWLENNTPKDARIAIMADDWVFPKYLPDRSYCPLFLDEGIINAYARGAEYIVVPRVFLEMKDRKTIKQLPKVGEIYSYFEKNILLARVYKLDYSKIHPVDNLSTEAPDWSINAPNNKPELSFDNSEIEVKYNFIVKYETQDLGNSNFVLNSKKKIKLQKGAGFEIEVFGDGESKNMTVFLRDENSNYYEYNLTLNWQGWKQVYIPFEFFNYSSGYIDKRIESVYLDYDKYFYLGFGVTSRDLIKGTFGIRNINLAKIDEDFTF